MIDSTRRTGIGDSVVPELKPRLNEMFADHKRANSPPKKARKGQSIG
jgi:hypothetical protein